MLLLAFARQYVAGLHSRRALHLHETARFPLHEIWRYMRRKERNISISTYWASFTLLTPVNLIQCPNIFILAKDDLHYV